MLNDIYNWIAPGVEFLFEISKHPIAVVLFAYLLIHRYGAKAYEKWKRKLDKRDYDIKALKDLRVELLDHASKIAVLSLGKKPDPFSIKIWEKHGGEFPVAWTPVKGKLGMLFIHYTFILKNNNKIKYGSIPSASEISEEEREEMQKIRDNALNIMDCIKDALEKLEEE